MVGKNRMKSFLLVLGVTLFTHGTVLPWSDALLSRLNKCTKKLNANQREIDRLARKKNPTKKDDFVFEGRLFLRDLYHCPRELSAFKKMLNAMAKNYYERIEDGSVKHCELVRKDREKLSLFMRQYRKCIAYQNQLKKDGTKILPGGAASCKNVFCSFGAQYFGVNKAEIMMHLEGDDN